MAPSIAGPGPTTIRIAPPGHSAAVATGTAAMAGLWQLGNCLLLAIVGAVLVYRATSSNASQLVLVTEGSTQVSVNYWAFLAPMLAWIGVALLCYRIAELVLRRGRRAIARASRPMLSAASCSPPWQTGQTSQRRSAGVRAAGAAGSPAALAVDGEDDAVDSVDIARS